MSDFSELFRSTEEQETPVEAKITGQIPPWLKGSFVRLGPGKFDIGDFTLNHWFDGYGVLYKFDITDGKVKFSKRFVQSDAYKKAVSVGRPVFTEFGTRSFPDPCKNIFSRMMSTIMPELTDNDAINIYTLEDSVYISTESNYLRRIDVNTLETLEKVDLHKLVGINLASSHTYFDEKGNYYSLGTSVVSGTKYHVIKIPQTSSGKAKDALPKSSILATIPSSWASNIGYYHSFGMSENYIVFIEQPFIINVLKMVTATLKGKSLRDCMDWHPEEKNKFFVIEKSSGKILPIKYRSAKPFFVFHHINTYEEDGHLIVDLVAYNSPAIVDKLYLQKLRRNEMDSSDPSGGRRFVLPLPKQNIENHPAAANLITIKTNAKAEKIGDVIELTSEDLSEPGYELPTVNQKYFGKKYQYYYCAGMYTPGPFRNSIVKVDTVTGDVKIWKENEYTYPGEVQFVSAPGSSAEDDGVLLSAVTDVRKDEPDYLLILDARTFKEIARAEVTVHIPNVIHGIFLHK